MESEFRGGLGWFGVVWVETVVSGFLDAGSPCLFFGTSKSWFPDLGKWDLERSEML